MKKIITHDIIKFETAKLAKEKGFTWYDIKMPFFTAGNINYLACYNDEGNVISPKIFNEKNKHYPAPTQDLLQKWLRENHNIDIEIVRIKDQYGGIVFKGFEDKIKQINVKLSNNLPIHSKLFDTYEYALEFYLYEGLKMLNI